MKKENLRKYKDIATRSFETKLNLFVFSKAVEVIQVHSLDANDFNRFAINDDIVIKYTAEYWQTERHKEIYGRKVDDIYNWMNGFKERNKDIIELLKVNYIQNFNQVFAEMNFEDMLQENKSCHYCGIKIENVEILAKKKKLFKKNERGWSLEIDRLNSNFEYTKENCVMSCYWCNNAKTDEFTEKEFKNIGEAIKKVWHDRLKESNIIGNFSDLTFIQK